MSRLDSDTRLAGMTALVYAGENAAEASRILKAQGIDVSERTIRTWRDKPDYIQLRNEIAPRVREIHAAQAEDMAARIHEAERKAVDLTLEQLENKDVKDASAVLKNLALSKGINIDKAQVLRGQPNMIVSATNADDLYREAAKIVQELEDMGISREDIVNLTDADVVDVAGEITA